jgi:hypothetical protein
VSAGLVGALHPVPAGAIGPTETKVACAVQPDAAWACLALVGDADPGGADPRPLGTMAFFVDAISSSAFLGQCTLGPTGSSSVSACLQFLFIPPGHHTVWAVYYPASGSPSTGSVASDDVGNPSAPPPDPTDTRVLCQPTAAAGAAQPLFCGVVVADDDSDAGPAAPTGTVAFFRDAISTSAFIGQCRLRPNVPSGLSDCGVVTAQLPPGSNTIWAVYYGDGNYQISVGSDPIVI